MSAHVPALHENSIVVSYRDLHNRHRCHILKLNGYQDSQSSVNVLAGSSTDVSGTLASSTQPTRQHYLPKATQSPTSLVSRISVIGYAAQLPLCTGRPDNTPFFPFNARTGITSPSPHPGPITPYFKKNPPKNPVL
jgi:hypothetical protein